ncbi:restriction endonuclease [Paenibacillus sp. IITD108]|uniref:restriction endonuclease n=1 Tax=Paenibacillus sp. IITD108 TaxID=3116649 RepID=UPI002F421ABC
MKHINSLTGQEFEKLVYEVFTKLGFRAQLTKASGDGGIDIIAHYDGLVFKGKYLIQCKRWVNTVGEPELRDLYGTTVAENALKGILVTTSTFSKQALEFSKGKNLELIDGSALSLLIETLTKTSEIGPIQTEAQIGFQNHPLFDSERYLMLDSKIKVDPKNEILQRVLIDNLFASILEMGKDALVNGLVDECFARLDIFKETFYQGKKMDHKYMRNYLAYDQAVLLFIDGKLSAAYEMLVREKIHGYHSPHVEVLKYIIAIKLGVPSVAQKYANNIARVFPKEHELIKIDSSETQSVLLHNENMNAETFENIIFRWPRSANNPIYLKQIHDLFETSSITDLEEQSAVFELYGEQ